jgi:threonine dehydrogenase-like Zn-dependent dehydrogenase
MKAVAAFPKSKEVKLIDVPEPRIERPAQAKIQMLEVGVCGTDREIWQFKYGEPPSGSDFLITGHEALGQVVEVGTECRDVRPGDLVVMTVRRGCPQQCVPCSQDQPDFCFTGQFTERGIKGRHGFMTEYVVEDERFLNVVPPALRKEAVLLEPLTITEKAVMELGTIQSRLHWECEVGRAKTGCRTALVLGAGPVGLLGAMVFRLLGMTTRVVAREKAPNRRSALLEEIEATYRSTEGGSAKDIAGEFENIDLIYEATGAAQVSFDFLQVLGTNGIFIFTGVPEPSKEMTLDVGTLMRNVVLKNQVILGTVNAPKEAFERGIQDLREIKKRWPKALDALITKRVPLARFNDAQKRDAKEIKTLLTIKVLAESTVAPSAHASL